VNLVTDVQALVERALPSADPATADRLQAAADRLHDPLRVALIGRAKAGKSTLLNALVGDLVAPTDAAECTLVPTEYHDGLTYRAWKMGEDGDVTVARFQRDDDGAHIELGDTPVEEVVRLLVEFPSSLLRDLTLVDTPGIGSVREQVSQRTLDFTSSAELAPADAVVYLLRNWHAVDSDFLLGFHDRVGLDVPPVNAVAVLSRADEVGGGDADALEQAGRLARSLAEDPTLRSLVAKVLPVAGLLAQSAVTLTEATYRTLATVASLDEGDVAAALLSVDRFVAANRLSTVAAADRQRLLSTLGLYGVRRAIEAIRVGRVTGAQSLSMELTRASGLDELHTVIFGQFAARATLIKAAQVLDIIEGALDSGQLRADPGLLAQLERIRVNGHAVVELRALNEVLCSPGLAMGPTRRSDIARALGSEGVDARTRVGLPASAADDELVDRLRVETRRWQALATSTVSLPDEQRLARIAVRSLTALLAALPVSAS
jgi:Dynamin family